MLFGFIFGSPLKIFSINNLIHKGGARQGFGFFLLEFIVAVALFVGLVTHCLAATSWVLQQQGAVRARLALQQQLVEYAEHPAVAPELGHKIEKTTQKVEFGGQWVELQRLRAVDARHPSLAVEILCTRAPLP